MKNVKLVLTILLSFMLLFSITTTVFAADESDDNFWSEPTLENVEDINIDTNENISLENSSNDVFGNSVSNENEDENDAYNWDFNDNDDNSDFDDDNDDFNSTTSNANNLADTGLDNSNGIIALIVVISLIVAIYSVKKMNDYNNL